MKLKEKNKIRTIREIPVQENEKVVVPLPLSTITYDREEIAKQTGNIYEAISIIAKRATQINSEIKRELTEKLEEFATNNDSLEEVFENKEQIEVSKYYERMPKPHTIAVKKWLEGKIYYRNTDESDSSVQ